MSVSVSLEDRHENVSTIIETSEVWLRFKVHNKVGREAAVNAEVLLLSIRRPLIRNGRKFIVPSRGLKWSDVPREQMSIPGNSWRRVDFLILAGKESASGHLAAPALQRYGPGDWPPEARHRLVDGGEYSFDVVLIADNADSTYWRITFTYTPMPDAPIDRMHEEVSSIAVKEIQQAEVNS